MHSTSDAKQLEILKAYKIFCQKHYIDPAPTIKFQPRLKVINAFETHAAAAVDYNAILCDGVMLDILNPQEYLSVLVHETIHLVLGHDPDNVDLVPIYEDEADKLTSILMRDNTVFLQALNKMDDWSTAQYDKNKVKEFPGGTTQHTDTVHRKTSERSPTLSPEEQKQLKRKFMDELKNYRAANRNSRNIVLY